VALDAKAEVKGGVGIEVKGAGLEVKVKGGLFGSPKDKKPKK